MQEQARFEIEGQTAKLINRTGEVISSFLYSQTPEFYATAIRKTNSLATDIIMGNETRIETLDTITMRESLQEHCKRTLGYRLTSRQILELGRKTISEETAERLLRDIYQAGKPEEN